MKIQVKGDGRNLRIVLPTALIFSKPAAWLYLRMGKYQTENHESDDTSMVHIPDEAMYAVCDELRRIKRKYGSWELVDIESAGGEKIQVTL